MLTIRLYFVRLLPTWSATREFLTFFGIQGIAYLNITVDYRAVAHQQYLVAALTNMVAPVIAWVMVRKIGEARNSRSGMVAVALAGALSTALGMWLTRVWG